MNIFCTKKNLYTTNARTFTHPILPLSIQSKIKTYNVDKFAAISAIIWANYLKSMNEHISLPKNHFIQLIPEHLFTLFYHFQYKER